MHWIHQTKQQVSHDIFLCLRMVLLLYSCVIMSLQIVICVRLILKTFDVSDIFVRQFPC